MSFLSRVKNKANHALPDRGGFGISGHGPMGFVVDKGERYGFAAGLGFLKGYYREKFMLAGQGGDLWVGVAGTLAGAALNMFSNGNSSLAPHLDRLGDAGMMSAINGWAVVKGVQKSGRAAFVLPAGSPQPAGSTRIAGSSVVGEIPPAMGGAYLTADEIARFSGRR